MQGPPRKTRQGSGHSGGADPLQWSTLKCQNAQMKTACTHDAKFLGQILFTDQTPPPKGHWFRPCLGVRRAPRTYEVVVVCAGGQLLVKQRDDRASRLFQVDAHREALHGVQLRRLVVEHDRHAVPRVRLNLHVLLQNAQNTKSC